MNTPFPPHAPIVVIGASAGGFRPLIEIIGPLPANFPGAVFIVTHIPSNATSQLAEILNKTSRMTCQQAVQAERIQQGHVYVAPPDFHLTIEDGLTILTPTLQVKSFRPSIDVLFESAAEGHGSQVTGVILSGLLDDGADGSRAIKEHGGLVLVQLPEEAEYASMPLSALRAAPVDGVMTIKEIRSFLLQLAERKSSDSSGRSQL